MMRSAGSLMNKGLKHSCRCLELLFSSSAGSLMNKGLKLTNHAQYCVETRSAGSLMNKGLKLLCATTNKTLLVQPAP